jgi:hypothetical protein
MKKYECYQMHHFVGVSKYFFRSLDGLTVFNVSYSSKSGTAMDFEKLKKLYAVGSIHWFDLAPVFIL